MLCFVECLERSVNQITHTSDSIVMGTLTSAMNKTSKLTESHGCHFCDKKCQNESALKEHEVYCKQQPSTSKGKNYH